jgi:class 3 adenylate cyclase
MGKVKKDELAEFLSPKELKDKKRLQSLLQNISLYVPRMLYADLARQEEALKEGIARDSAVLIADISGFTALSEKLSKIGKEGAEEITEIVNSYFSRLLDIIFMYGGDLFHFSGDALSAVYHGDEKQEDKEVRALLTAWEMKQMLKTFSTVKTSKGSFPLKVHISLHAGSVHSVVVGAKESGLYYLMCGKTMNEIEQLEEMGRAGEINLSKVFHTAVKGKATFEKKAKDRYILKGIATEVPVQKIRQAGKASGKIDVMRANIQKLRPFINRELFSKIVASPEGLDVWGEHKNVTILFLNFRGFDFDRDEKAVMNLQRYFSELQATVERYDGSIDKIDLAPHGHNVIVLFGVPFAHEDDEERAVRCAYEILSGVWSQTLKIEMRVGINSGYVFAGNVGSGERREYTVMGDEVNLAARLLSRAKASDIIVSHSTYGKIKEVFDLERKREVRLKGKAKPVKIYRVLSEKKKVEAFERLRGGECEIIVGREAELKQLQEIARKVEKGKGQIILVEGEAGVGKSRLTREFIDVWLKQKYEFALGSCQFYGKPISYHPWKEPLMSYLGLKKEALEEEKKKTIEAFMKDVNPALPEWSPIIGELLDLDIEETKLTSSIDAKLRKQRLFDIILDLLSYSKKTGKRRKREPLLIVIEDFHWADAASIELLTYIARNIKDLPILLAVITRPVKEKWQFSMYPHYHEMVLKELSGDEVHSLVGALLDMSEPSANVVDFIRRETQGNPFYVEELTRSLIERNILRKAKGTWIFPEDISRIEIPDTIQGIIMSRIDRLPQAIKQVLLMASVIGREFSYSTLEGICPKDSKKLKGYLSSLRYLDLLLYQKEEKDERYIFKHILTQEVAYDSISYKRKRDLHLKVGNFIERAYRRSIEEVLGFLTHHFYRGKDWEKAFYYSIEAGDKAKRAYANIEALSYYDKALEILDIMNKTGLLEDIWKRIKAEIKKS